MKLKNSTTGILLALLSLIGGWASWMLLESEFKVLRDPAAGLACDLNPLIGCSESLLSSQAHLLGLPNSAIGLMIFTGIFVFGVLLFLAKSLPKLAWWALLGGLIIATGYVAYFLTISVTIFRSLCPYCLVVWAVILAMLPIVVLQALVNVKLFGVATAKKLKPFLNYYWAFALIFYLIVIFVIVIALPEKIVLL